MARNTVINNTLRIEAELYEYDAHLLNTGYDYGVSFAIAYLLAKRSDGSPE